MSSDSVRRPDRRAILGALGAGAASAALAAYLDGCARPASSGGGAQALRVAVFKGGAETFLKAAGQAATPYRLDLAEFAAGNLIVEAIRAGAVDLGSMSEIPPIFAAGGVGPALRLIAVLKGDVNNQVMLVPKGSRIDNPAQLKGRTVGYVRATTSQFLLIRILAEHGLTFADIKPVALSPQDGRTAFERGSLDAWVAYGVEAQLARARAGARVLATGQGRLSGNYLYAASPAALDDPARRGAIADYLRRIQAIYAWAEAHPDDWAALSSAATGVPAAVYAQQRRERSGPTYLAPVDAAAVASQQTVADAFTKAGVLPKRVDVTPLWEQSFNGELAGLPRTG
jgi:sulfonate transport system substrate-binding protein